MYQAKCIILFLLFTFPLFGNEVPKILHYTKNDYKAQNKNWGITQSSDHRMFFSNSQGLLVFDGRRWFLHTLPERQIIRTVTCDQQDLIFTGGYGSFGYWKSDSLQQFTFVPLIDQLQSEQAEEEEVWHTLVWKDRVLFQSFSQIYLYDYQKIKELTPPGNIMFSSKIDDRVLVPTIHLGLFELTQDLKFEFISGTEGLINKRVASILKGNKEKELIIGTQNNGLYLYEEGQLIEQNHLLNKVLQRDQLNRAIRLSNGNYVFGTILNGIYITDADFRILFHINKENGLQNNTILALLEDKRGNLWVGMDKGIDFIELDPSVVFYYDQRGNVGTVYSAATFGDYFYIGTNQGVFYRKTKAPTKFSAMENFQLLEGSQSQVWQLKVIDNQLICGHNLGTFLIEGTRIEKISDLTGGWHTISFPNRSDVLLQATYTGLGVFNQSPAGKWQYAHRVAGFIRPLKKILIDQKENIWGIHPQKGLFRFRLSPDLTRITELKEFSEQDGLPTTYRIHLFSLEGKIIVQSNGQFFEFNNLKQQFEPVKTTNQLELNSGDYRLLSFPNDHFFKVYQDSVIWINSGHHQTFYLPLLSDFEGITQLDSITYILSLDNGYALLKDKKEHVLPRDFALPEPQITEVRIGQDYAIFPTEWKNTNRTITFAPHQNNLRFYCAFPSFTTPSKLEYALNGFQDHWDVFPTESFKEFTNLSPGNYEFKLRTNERATITRFAFIIEPKWYQTNLAYFIYGLTAIGLLYIFHRLHRLRLERQHRKLVLEKERRFHQQMIKARNEQLQKDLINKSKELANSTISLVRKNEILMKIKEELKALRKGISSANFQKLFNLIDRNLTSEKDWQVFESNFSEVHDSFFKKLKADYPELTPGDLRIAAYLKMNLSSKEIAPLLNISIRSVENRRYRLRKKLNLPQKSDLIEFMMRY